MATPRIAVPAVALQFPSQPSPKAAVISQTELALVTSLRDRAKQLQAQIEEAEHAIQERLEAGGAVENGVLKAFLKTTERRSVAWKAVCERQLGEPYCARVLAATKPDKFVHLVIAA